MRNCRPACLVPNRAIYRVPIDAVADITLFRSILRFRVPALTRHLTNRDLYTHFSSMRFGEYAVAKPS